VWAARFAAVAAVFSLVFAERYYNSHPQLLEHQLGSAGMAILELGMGCLLLWQAVAGVRNGTISGNYTSKQYERSDDPGMFWFIVAFDGAGGAFLLVGAWLTFGLPGA
jgi:ribose 5-phosphate isomerase RpiB